MREYLYNVRMSLKNHGLIKSAGIILTLTRLHIKKIFSKGDAPKRETIHGLKIWFFNYKSLTGLYEELFVQRQYFFSYPGSNPVIIDCGSNIGMSVLYFKKLYPKARITAFEPDPETFKLLDKTVRDNGFSDVKAINAAVAEKRGSISFYSDKTRPGNLHMSLIKSRVENGTRHHVPGDRLSSHIKGKVDFVKIDIEGAEAGVISEVDRAKKLKKIAMLAVEIHHNIPGGTDILNRVTGLLIKNKMNYVVSAAAVPPYECSRYQDILLLAQHCGRTAAIRNKNGS